MNAIEQFKERILAELPTVQVQLEEPAQPEGVWTLDLRTPYKMIGVTWQEDQGFGINHLPSEGLGDKNDELYTNPETAFARVKELFLVNSPTGIATRHYVKVECTGCAAVDIVTLQGVLPEFATHYCGLLDGTSPMFVHPPSKDPNSKLGKCIQCGAQIHARLITKDEFPPGFTPPSGTLLVDLPMGVGMSITEVSEPVQGTDVLNRLKTRKES